MLEVALRDTSDMDVSYFLRQRAEIIRKSPLQTLIEQNFDVLLSIRFLLV